AAFGFVTMVRGVGKVVTWTPLDWMFTSRMVPFGENCEGPPALMAPRLGGLAVTFTVTLPVRPASAPAGIFTPTLPASTTPPPVAVRVVVTLAGAVPVM